jgi:hypothetical protein
MKINFLRACIAVIAFLILRVERSGETTQRAKRRGASPHAPGKAKQPGSEINYLQEQQCLRKQSFIELEPAFSVLLNFKMHMI